MSKVQSSSAAKNKSAQKEPLFTKKRILTSVLTGFSVPFVLLICSSLGVFFSNSSELQFSLWDYLPLFILISVIAFAVITLALLFTRGALHNTIFTVLSALTVCAYIESIVTNLTFSGLPGDGSAVPRSQIWIILDFFVWVILISVAIWFCVLSDKSATGKTVLSFLLVLVLVMQIAGLIPSAVEFADKESEKNPVAKPATSYLTTKGMFELSKNDNIIVFVIDRFDSYYYKELINYDPDFFRDYEGFTYYSDNISLYPRTYPAVTSMLTGVENDYSSTRQTYFNQAYTRGHLIPDLAENNYKINLFIPSYYAYENANVFGDYVSNISTSTETTISSYDTLTSKMFELSSYFWVPELLKSQSIASNSFSGIVEYGGSSPKYEMSNNSDPDIYSRFQSEGIKTQSSKNTFTFLHLRGCHYPFTMDENCNAVAENSVSSVQQTRGCFKLISEYIEQMKELGIYDNATIIITGDHAMLDTDYDEYTNENLTALIIKRKGETGEYKTSNVPVSQANFLASIVKSAGLDTENDYGRAYWEVPADETYTRTHYFQRYTGNERKDENITYEITGNGNNFSNWRITDREVIGYIYK